MGNLTDKAWWEAAGTRAIKTVAQTAIATISTAAVIESVDWKMVLSASLLAGFLSLLTSIKGLPEVKTDDKSEAAEEEENIDNVEDATEISSKEAK